MELRQPWEFLTRRETRVGMFLVAIYSVLILWISGGSLYQVYRYWDILPEEKFFSTIWAALFCYILAGGIIHRAFYSLKQRNADEFGIRWLVGLLVILLGSVIWMLQAQVLHDAYFLGS